MHSEKYIGHVVESSLERGPKKVRKKRVGQGYSLCRSIPIASRIATVREKQCPPLPFYTNREQMISHI